ncbi:MAG: hypothetical protein IKM54_06835 [Butyricicoccus sp.]|nr:hypothetical protein [Butyricicoccus sp.]
MIRAFHTAWSAPLFARDPDARYGAADFELLTTALSALLWRQQNGPIDLYCDEIAYAYYESLDLTDLWDAVYPLPLDAGLDADCFWAAGKLLALRQSKTPCVMLDTDFIVWQPLEDLLRGLPLAVIHREPLDSGIYPDPQSFCADASFDLSGLDLTEPAANTALAWFSDEDFKNRYCDTALDFMRHAQPRGDRLTHMVFAEQRLLPMLSAQNGIPLTALSDLPTLFFSEQKLFTHTWGSKQLLRADPAARNRFCRRCAARIERDFPAFSPRLAAIRGLAQYFTNR